MSSLVSKYERFILKNANSISSIESTLRSLSYVLPGRFKDAELASESIYSGVQLLGLYHDHLLARAVKKDDKTCTLHRRYTQFWDETNGLYRRAALTLSVIQYTELLVEMFARKRWSDKGRWKVIVLLEVVKAICRLILLHVTDSRPLLTPPLPERDTEAVAPEVPVNGLDHEWIMPRTGVQLPKLPSKNVHAFLLAKVLTADDVRAPFHLLHQLQRTGRAAELLHILRPLVYALAMQHWQNDRKSWYPFLLGLSMEYMARRLIKHEFQQTLPGGLKGLTKLEKEELNRRAKAMTWWLLRGAFYENVTKYVLVVVLANCRVMLDGLVAKTSDTAVTGMIGSILGDYQHLWNNYFYSSTFRIFYMLISSCYSLGYVRVYTSSTIYRVTVVLSMEPGAFRGEMVISPRGA